MMEYTITFQRTTKPAVKTVLAAIRKDTGNRGDVRLTGYRKLPAQYESPCWQFRYELKGHDNDHGI